MYLPTRVLEAFRPHGSGGEPLQAVHALNSLAGGLGDTYLLAASDGIFLYTSQVGQDSQALFLPYPDIAALELREDRPFVFLRLRAGDQDSQLKFSTMDREPLGAIAQLWGDARTGKRVPPAAPPAAAPATPVAPPVPPPPAAVKLTPLVGFCAAAYALIQADGNVATEEVEALARAVANRDAMARGLEYLCQHGPAALFAELRDMLGQDQKLCLLANLVDLAMADNTIHSTEKSLLHQFRETLGVEPNDYDAIFDVLLLRHSVGVFPDA